MRRLLSVLTIFFAMCASTQAQTGTLIERYYAALKMDEVFDILQQEGLEAAREIAEEDEAITLSSAWMSRVGRIYTEEKMDAAFRSGLDGAADLAGSETAIAFFESDLGQRIVDVELTARTALNDEDTENAARELARSLKEEDPDRLALYTDFIAANNLIDSNVMGALNANLAFYQGLGTSPLFGALDENTILRQVYDQESQIRADMEDWVMNFSVLAYGILSEEEMQSYVEMSKTPAGQILNRALFAGFDQVFEMHSFELGQAMSEFMAGDDT